MLTLEKSVGLQTMVTILTDLQLRKYSKCIMINNVSKQYGVVTPCQCNINYYMKGHVIRGHQIM